MIGAKLNVILLFMAISAFNWKCCHTLVFPQFTQFQLTLAMSLPAELVPDRKFFFDWGFQMNYDTPYNVSNFYNVPIWPKRSKRFVGVDNFSYKNSNDLDYAKYGISGDRHASDFTAGEFYMSIEDLLVENGFHESCLLLSVCDLAQHPFHNERKNLISEVLTFVLTPSQHEAFGADETSVKDAYEMAEVMGFKGEDCARLYPHCKRDFLGLISLVTFDKN